MKIAVILFILMYVLIIFLPKYRVWAALGIAALFLVLGILPIGEVPAAINWNALMMMSGTMILVYYFIESGMPGKIADLLLGKSIKLRVTRTLWNINNNIQVPRTLNTKL